MNMECDHINPGNLNAKRISASTPKQASVSCQSAATQCSMFLVRQRFRIEGSSPWCLCVLASYTFRDNSTQYKTESVNFLGLMNSATRTLCVRFMTCFLLILLLRQQARPSVSAILKPECLMTLMQSGPRWPN